MTTYAARIYALEAKYEFLKLVRIPAFAIPSITFPVMFYVLFGLAFGGGRAFGGVAVATYLIATYGAFGVIGASLFGFGAGVAAERGQGWMLLKRATPMPPSAYFFAKVAVCLTFGAVIVLLLSAIGVAFGGVRLDPVTWTKLGATLLFGGIPFCALGLAIGYFAGPNSAPPLVNLVYLPMAFGSGLWIPFDFLPPAVRAVSPFLPAYHLAQMALTVIGAGRGAPLWSHATALVGFTFVFLALGYWGYRKDEGKTYG
jgi:ABC-2 type transport system permease protein